MPGHSKFPFVRGAHFMHVLTSCFRRLKGNVTFTGKVFYQVGQDEDLLSIKEALL